MLKMDESLPSTPNNLHHPPHSSNLNGTSTTTTNNGNHTSSSSSSSNLTPKQTRARQAYLNASSEEKYWDVDRVLTRRGGRTDKAFAGGEVVSEHLLPSSRCWLMKRIHGLGIDEILSEREV